jgi:hypothetical protein
LVLPPAIILEPDHRHGASHTITAGRINDDEDDVNE